MLSNPAGAYDDISKDGIFPKDSSLKEFLVSGPAVLAALQMQIAFERKHSKAECEQMIEDYAYWGGDKGLTEQTMREACGMPLRDLRSTPTRAATVIVVEDEAGPEPSFSWWDKVADVLVIQLLSQRKLDITEPMLKRKQWKHDVQDLPNMSKEDLIDAMKAKKVLISSNPRGKTDTVLVPGLSTKVSLQTIVPFMDRSHCPQLQEMLSLEAFASYVHGCQSRAENAAVLQAVYRNLSNATTKKGRPTIEGKKQKDNFDEKVEKILNHEKTCANFLKHFKEPQPVLSQSPARKRLRMKGPDAEVASQSDRVGKVKQESARAVKEEATENRNETKPSATFIQTQYAYPSTTTLRTRKMVQGFGAQKLTRRAQAHMVANTHDLDICNSVFTLLAQLVQKLEVSPSMPAPLLEVLQGCALRRDEICATELKVNREEGKRLLTSTLYGGQVPEHFETNEFLADLSKVSIYLRWLAISLLEDEFHRFRSSEVNKKNPDMSILSHLYLALEDYVLTAWVGYLETLKPVHLSLHFDGVRVSAFEDLSVQDICKHSEDYIAQQTGFRVSIREKKHRTVIQSIKHMSAEQEPSMSTGNSLLEQNGNCIPAAIAAHLGKQPIEKALSEEPQETSSQLIRSYSECQSLCNVSLVPCLEFSKLQTGFYLLHCEASGTPHCAGLRFQRGQGGTCLLYDQDGKYKLKSDTLAEAIESGTDVSSCVFFRVCEPGKPEDCDHGLNETDLASLLNLEAAGLKKPASILGGVDCQQSGNGRKRRACQEAVAVHDSASDEDIIEVQSNGAVGSPHRAGEQEEAEEEDMEADRNDGWLEDSGLVVVDSVLLKELADEVSAAIKNGKFRKTPRGFACPCCPWRCFQWPRRVAEHLLKYHVEKKQFCCSGKKQIKCILSMHDSDMISSGKPHGKYLQRSAKLLREQVRPPLSCTNTSIDKSIRLVLDCTGLARVG